MQCASSLQALCSTDADCKQFSFESCYACNSGGAINALSQADVSIYDSNFTNNTASGKGGALYAYQVSKVLLQGCVFEKPIFRGHNAIARDNEKTEITFACDPKSSSQMTAQMKGNQISTIPPKELHCRSTPTPAPAETTMLKLGLVACIIFISVGFICFLLRSKRAKSKSDALLSAQYNEIAVGINDDHNHHDRLEDGINASLSSACRNEMDPAVAAMLAAVTVKRTHINLIKKIGQGSAGTVWEANFAPSSTAESQIVAVKCFTPGGIDDPEAAAERSSAFMNEVIQMARCYKHKCLVQLLGVCPAVADADDCSGSASAHPTGACIVMRRYDFNLSQYFTHLAKSTSEATRWHYIVRTLRDVAEGMCVLHNFPRPIVHKDLKPSNVFVSGSDGRACVGDLGMAKVIGSTGHTQHFGSLAYRAPENFDGLFTKASDVYAMGMLIYTAIMHPTRPWDGLTDAEMIKRVVIGRRSPPLDHTKLPGCPQRLIELMKDCWRHAADLRPSFDSIKRQLDQMASTRVVGFLCSPEVRSMSLHLLPEWRALQQAVPAADLALYPMADITEFDQVLQTTDARVLHLALHNEPFDSSEDSDSSHSSGSGGSSSSSSGGGASSGSLGNKVDAAAKAALMQAETAANLKVVAGASANASAGVGAGASMLNPHEAAKARARAAALKLSAKLGSGSGSGSGGSGSGGSGSGSAGGRTGGGGGSAEHFSAKLEINDYPQKARHKILQAKLKAELQEEYEVAIIQRGSYVMPHTKPQPGEEKLHLLIEGTNQQQVQLALREIHRQLEEITMEIGAQMSGARFGKYNVL
eukprot:g1458.t1